MLHKRNITECCGAWHCVETHEVQELQISNSQFCTLLSEFGLYEESKTVFQRIGRT